MYSTQRAAQGEPLEQLCAEPDLAIDPGRLVQLQAKHESAGRAWQVLVDGRFGHPFKADSALREWLYERKRQDKDLTAPAVVKAVKAQFGVELSASHINSLLRGTEQGYLLRKVELTHPPGDRSSGLLVEKSQRRPKLPAMSWTMPVFFP